MKDKTDVSNKMGLRRCRWFLLLLTLASLITFYYIINNIPQTSYQATQLTETLQSEESREEIELTEEDRRQAAEKAKRLKNLRLGPYPLSPDRSQNQNLQVQSSFKQSDGKEWKLSTQSPVKVTTSDPVKEPINDAKENMHNRNSRIGGFMSSTKVPLLHKPATVKYGSDIIVDASKYNTKDINFPALPTMSPTSLTKPPGLTSKVKDQLKFIDGVKQKLQSLQTSMQNDRIYHQFQVNLSRQTDSVEDADREKNIETFEKTNHPHAIDIPNNSPDREHGYPIEVISPVQVAQPLRLAYSNKIYYSVPGQNKGEILAVEKNSAQLSNHNDLDNAEQEYPKQIGEYDIPDIRSQASYVINNIYQGQETKDVDDQNSHHNQLNGQSDNSDTVIGQNTESDTLMNVKNVNVMDTANELQQDAVTFTTKPSGISFNQEVKYEHMPNGDLTVHNAPKDEAQKSQYISTEVLSNPNSTSKQKDKPISLKFVDFLSDNVKNDTVATVTKAHIQRPTKLKTMNEFWQVHMAKEAIYMYSAYFDDRPGLDRNMIRVIGIANAAIVAPHCLLWYPNQTEPDVSVTIAIKIGARIQPLATSRNRYEPYIFSCDIVIGKGPPEFVSLITVTDTTPTTLLRVQIPVKPPPEEQIEVGQCMSVIYWKQDPVRLIEWIEMNRILGVGEISAYADNLSEEASEVFTNYAKEGYVNFQQLPNILDDDSEFTILLNMSPAINDCMYRNMYRYKKVVCTDVDELIVPRTAWNYTEMLDQIVAMRGSGHPHPSFMFRNVYFFTDFGPHVEEPWFLFTQRYLKHITPSEYGYSVKSITDPLACVALHNHLCWKRVKEHDKRNWSIDVPLRLGRNQHYKKCHFDGYLGQLGACDRMMQQYFVDKNMERFQPDLYQMTSKKLLELEIAVPA